MESVTLYTTNCPKCNVLKEKLDRANIPYEIGKTKELVEAGFRSAPMIKAQGEFLGFAKAVEWIKENAQ